MSDTGDRQQSRPGDQVSERWARWRIAVDLEEYFTRWHRLDQSGHSPHGEADLVASFGPSSVLDAGCGMGRVAIELRRRGIDVVGTDLDDDLLDYARRADPSIEWVCADLAALRLDRRFDVVVMAGNVMVFCRPADRSAIVANLAGHLPAGGLLVAGFDLERDETALTLAAYDAMCSASGLGLVERWATWDREPYRGGAYAVSVHRGGEAG